MLELFKLLGSAVFVWFLFFTIKNKYLQYLTIIVLGISIFGYGAIYVTYLGKKVEQKTEAINKSVEKVGDSINKLGKSVDKINNNPVVKGTKKATNAIDEADKKIKDYGFKVREKILGKKTKRLED